jgi:hypothetical protein
MIGLRRRGRWLVDSNELEAVFKGVLAIVNGTGVGREVTILGEAIELESEMRLLIR